MATVPAKESEPLLVSLSLNALQSCERLLIKPEEDDFTIESDIGRIFNAKFTPGGQTCKAGLRDEYMVIDSKGNAFLTSSTELRPRGIGVYRETWNSRDAILAGNFRDHFKLGNTEIGYLGLIESRFWCSENKYEVVSTYGAKNTKVFEIVGDKNGCSICCSPCLKHNWSFEIRQVLYDNSNSVVIGEMCTKWLDYPNEIFGISFPKSLNNYEKALLMLSGLVINGLYFKDRKYCCCRQHGDFGYRAAQSWTTFIIVLFLVPCVLIGITLTVLFVYKKEQ